MKNLIIVLIKGNFLGSNFSFKLYTSYLKVLHQVFLTRNFVRRCSVSHYIARITKSKTFAINIVVALKFSFIMKKNRNVFCLSEKPKNYVPTQPRQEFLLNALEFAFRQGYRVLLQVVFLLTLNL